MISTGKSKKIVFAGAGTAGHVEPALAVAHWISVAAPDVEISFIGTTSGVETKLVTESGFSLHLISKAPFPRRLNFAALLWPFKFAKSTIQVGKLLSGANLIIGFGGYVAAPTYLVARLMGIPILIHEANAKTGMANTLGKLLGGTLLQAFDDGRSAKENVQVGIPLRISIIKLAQSAKSERSSKKKSAREKFNLENDRPVILVFGGSLGARRFNDVVSQSIEELLRRKYQVLHAVGRNNALPEKRLGYSPVPYIDQMSDAYCAADLVISRGGAVSVVETGALGIYSIYVPLDIGNGEQRQNANFVVQQGGGIVVDNSKFTSTFLLEHIDQWLQKALEYQSAGSKVNFPLNSAELIGERALKLI